MMQLRYMEHINRPCALYFCLTLLFHELMYERSYITLRDLTEHIQTFSQLLLYSFFSPIGLFFFFLACIW